MYCSTCGAKVPDGRSRCDACGAAVARPAGHGLPAPTASSPAHAPAHDGVAVCPRCGFRGPSVAYFSQAGPLFGAIVLALLSLPLMGAAGILYFALRHDHRSCPQCGENWGKHAERALAIGGGGGGGPALPAGGSTRVAVPEGGGGVGFFVLAALLIFFGGMFGLVGLAEAEAGMVLFGALAAGGGGFAVRAGRRAREERRRALIVALQQPVLRLASERGGRLTVTDVASSLGWPLPRAEKVLNSLEDGLRVASDVTDEGVIVYEFRELAYAPRLRASAEPMLPPGPGGAADGTLRA